MCFIKIYSNSLWDPQKESNKEVLRDIKRKEDAFNKELDW